MEDLVSPFFFVSFSILIPFYFLFIQGPVGDLKCLLCIAHGAEKCHPPIPVFLLGLRLLYNLATLVPLTVAFPALSATRPMRRIVLIRSWPMSLFSTWSLFGRPASLPLSVSLPLYLVPFIFLILESFFSF